MFAVVVYHDVRKASKNDYRKCGVYMMLTPKQEKFCQCIVSGMTGKDSYITAYDTKCSDQVAYNESSKLLLREDIQARLEVMRKPLVKAVQATALTEREKIKSILWERLQKAIDREDDAVIVKITDQINRMNSEYANVNINLDDKTPDIKNIDTTLLEKLAKSS